MVLEDGSAQWCGVVAASEQRTVCIESVWYMVAVLRVLSIRTKTWIRELELRHQSWKKETQAYLCMTT